jgi:hypothetical protein
LADRWRQIEKPDPWPFGLGDQILFEFAGVREVEFVGLPGLIFEVPLEWRETTPIREIRTWADTDAWPGPLPEEEHP